MAKLIAKISKASREIPIEVGRFVNKQYPAFVTNGNLLSLEDEVPVLMFHTAKPRILKEQLEYLKANNYQTLNLETFIAFLNGEVKLQKPSVLLTFDDGEKSWYEVAFPLLKQYGFNAIGFVVSAYIQEKEQAKTGEKTWLSWSELIEMDQAGVIEIESHSYSHARVFTTPQLIDFFNPQFSDALGLDVPWIHVQGTETNQLEWGMPIFRDAPRLVGQPRYLDNPDIRKACVAWVKDRGGAAFFEQPNWKKQLTQYFYTVQDSAFESCYESAEQVKQHMLSDLVKAKDLLSERLNKPIKHLCYPWGIGSELAVQLSQEAGYISNFWVSLDDRNTNKPGDSPFYIPRLKDDYLFRLPGQGRHSLLKIFREKLKRRSKSMEIY